MVHRSISIGISALFFFALCLQNACSASEGDSVITIGTFNIEWLGDGDSLDMKHRSEEDYHNIARIIEEADADVLGVQEVENSVAIERVLKYLPAYHFKLGHSGHVQNVGVLYKNTVTIDGDHEYLPLATNPERNRPGFVFHCVKNGFDATIMVVHLKSTSRADSTRELKLESYENRRAQIHVLCHWLDSTLSDTVHPDVMVIGDFNDFAYRQQNATLGELLADSSVVMLTKDEHSCKDPKWYTIDHLVVSKHLSSRWLAPSLHHVSVNARLNAEEAKGVSDHCPVVGQFSCK